MKLYFACGPYLTFVQHLRRVRDETGFDPFPAHILISYLDVRRGKLEPRLRKFFQDPSEIDLFMDSGAFGAFSARINLDVKVYGQWLLDNQDWITQYANLDVKHSAEQTADNQAYLESLGLHPLPVWHGNEPIQLWEDMVSKYPYVCLGGVAGVGKGASNALAIISKCMKISHSYGTKVHMFGSGTPKVLGAVNFYSADSTSFIQSKYGRVIVWDERDMTTRKIKLCSPDMVKYEHFLARYGIETSPLFTPRPGKYGYQIIRTYEYLSFQRMAEWLDAVWKKRAQLGLAENYIAP